MPRLFLIIESAWGDVLLLLERFGPPMRPEEIELARRSSDLVKQMTDEQIQETAREIAFYPRRADFARIGNYVEIKRLRKRILKGGREVPTPVGGPDQVRLWECETLYIEAFYGPCCIWARATMENILLEGCLHDSDLKEDLEKEIRRRKGKNPRCEWLIKKLIGSSKARSQRGEAEARPWTDEDLAHCKKIADNGDHVVHHRKDKISQGKGYKDYLRSLGISVEELEDSEFKTSAELIVDSFRSMDEKRMAKESLEGLYRLFERRKG